jgi:hypothetical protein
MSLKSSHLTAFFKKKKKVSFVWLEEMPCGKKEADPRMDDDDDDDDDDEEEKWGLAVALIIIVYG